MRIHATAAALWTREGWRAVLLRGPSGAGKSDLALRLLGRGWRLVGDDYVEAWASGGAVYCAPAPRIEGLIEARGVGLIATPCLRLARVGLIADCGETPDRLPDPDHETLDGAAVPRLAVAALEPSAPEKLAAALGGRDQRSRLEA